jgi:hypothetical protein
MTRILLALTVLVAAPLVTATANAQPCCQGYRVRYYRVHPYYQYAYPAPQPPRWSVGVHGAAAATNQMFDRDAVVLGGLGGHVRFRGYRWGTEFAVDALGGEYLGGKIQRVSVPFQISALLYLIPEGRFNLFLLGGMRLQPTWMDMHLSNISVSQTFAEFGLHGGAGAEIVLTPGFALTGDFRFFGMFRNNSDPPGEYYKSVDDGLLPAKSAGIQFNFGASFRF